MKKLSIRKKALVFTATALSALAVTGAVSASAADGQQVTCYKGDVNIDYEVNIKDLSFMYKYINHTKDDFTSDQLEIADVNGDGDVNIKDYSLVYKHINKTKEIQPNHSYVETVVEPTETANGYTLHKCAVCGDEYKDNYVDASGQPVTETTEATSQTTTEATTEATTDHVHSYVSTITAPTYSTMGYTQYTCEICDSWYKTDFIEPLALDSVELKQLATDHTISFIFKSSRVNTNGSFVATYVCSCGCGYSCSVIYGSSSQEMMDCTHDFEVTYCTNGEEPTCTKDTQVQYKCSVCGQEYCINYNKLGHIQGTYVETVAPTCADSGYTVYLCDRCGKQIDYDYVDKLDHTYQETVVAPTCTDDGYTLMTCSVCGYSEKTDYVARLGHKYGDWITTKEPTCEEEGSKERTCSVCNDVETEIIYSTGHDYYTSTVVKATNSTLGYTQYECKVCGKEYKDDFVKSDGTEFSYTSNTEVTGEAEAWLKENIINTNLTTLEKIKLINEYTRKLLKANDNIFDDRTDCTSDYYKELFGSKWSQGYTWNFFDIPEVFEKYYDGLPVYETTSGITTSSSTVYDVLNSGGVENTSYGVSACRYDQIFVSLCRAAAIEVYQDESDINLYYVIKNGTKYYTCPLLNAYSDLGKYGAENINTYTNVAEGSDLFEQLEEQKAKWNANRNNFTGGLRVCLYNYLCWDNWIRLRYLDSEASSYSDKVKTEKEFAALFAENGLEAWNWSLSGINERLLIASNRTSDGELETLEFCYGASSTYNYNLDTYGLTVYNAD